MTKRTFKEYITEDNSTHYPWQATSNEELLKLPNWSIYKDDLIGCADPQHPKEWLITGKVDSNGFFEIHDDWPTISDGLLVEHGGQWYLPFRIKEWKREFNRGELILTDSKISSFIGFPDKIDGALNITACHYLTIEGCPSIVNGNVTWHHMPLTYRMDKVFKEVNGTIIIPKNYKGFLSFLKIKKLDNMLISATIAKEDIENVKKAKLIVFDHLRGDRNILTCQEELMNNGLKEYAKL